MQSPDDTKAEEKVTITLQDISAMIRIIDVVSSRGAVQAGEMQIVGTLYERLQLFIKQNKNK